MIHDGYEENMPCDTTGRCAGTQCPLYFTVCTQCTYVEEPNQEDCV